MSRAVHDFWSTFAEVQSALLEAKSSRSQAYEVLLGALQGIHSGLYIEFCANASPAELIITADGQIGLFELVDTIVRSAPPHDGWVVLALKPRIGFPEAVTWNGLSVRIADAQFDPVQNGRTGEFGIVMYLCGIGEAQVQDAHNALLRAIDHGIGERRFAEEIKFTDLRVLDDQTDPKNLIPLLELESFLDWQKKSGQPGATDNPDSAGSQSEKSSSS